jgi:hypothetical protein
MPAMTAANPQRENFRSGALQVEHALVVFRLARIVPLAFRFKPAE